MNEKKPTNPWAKSLLIWVGILFGLVVFVQMIGGGSKAATGETIAYSEFVRQVDERNVQSVTTSSTASGNQVITGKLEGGQTFRTTAPADAQVTDRLIKAGVNVQAKEAEQSSVWYYLLIQSLPFILMGLMGRCATGKNRIRGLLPWGTKVEHKTGTLNNYASDVGYITMAGWNAILSLSGAALIVILMLKSRRA